MKGIVPISRFKAISCIVLFYLLIISFVFCLFIKPLLMMLDIIGFIALIYYIIHVTIWYYKSLRKYGL